MYIYFDQAGNKDASIPNKGWLIKPCAVCGVGFGETNRAERSRPTLFCRATSQWQHILGHEQTERQMG
jgi:hypothetical protein